MLSAVALAEHAFNKALHAAWARSWSAYVSAESFRQAFDETPEEAKARSDAAFNDAAEAVNAAMKAVTRSE